MATNVASEIKDIKRPSPAHQRRSTVVLSSTLVAAEQDLKGTIGDRMSRLAWKAWNLVWHSFFLLFLGVVSTDRLREVVEEYEKWRRFKKSLFERYANINIIASLLMTTTAVFLTTQPTNSIADWSAPLPYKALGATFGLAFLSVASGTFILFVGTDLQASVVEDMLAQPYKFAPALLLLALPNLFVAAAAIAGVTATCIAVWNGDSPPAQIVLSFVVVVLFVMVSAFAAIALWAASRAERDDEPTKDSVNDSSACAFCTIDIAEHPSIVTHKTTFENSKQIREDVTTTSPSPLSISWHPVKIIILPTTPTIDCLQCSLGDPVGVLKQETSFSGVTLVISLGMSITEYDANVMAQSVHELLNTVIQMRTLQEPELFDMIAAWAALRRDATVNTTSGHAADAKPERHFGQLFGENARPLLQMRQSSG
ncbi:hypothetical protein POSPLADRAFT_1044848 [Postia placenta MAD-698-R-SB12]|uniref:Uncharacterized protein n=1 Tax=Postia placenta MAD-698-R-SB12 TaxID=670580 RepID=A0A1X6NAE5_9APHY|nr:hypothetical protein POSPLADRAFT_1044848 [Postia placenta MAD-698-R-SB12]OSX65490.1 hypothetical protein POSPLADRAFT_1044848 [Postia placenta MAD-698-R-SB12]